MRCSTPTAGTSLEHFLPAAVASTCSGTGGVVALNTATDNQTIASDLSSGGADLGFVDDPADPNFQASLTSTKQQYTYIPVAVSATVVASLASAAGSGVGFPLPASNLTPNMLAGLITTSTRSRSAPSAAARLRSRPRTRSCRRSTVPTWSAAR